MKRTRGAALLLRSRRTSYPGLPPTAPSASTRCPALAGSCRSEAIRGQLRVLPDRPTKIVLRRPLESAQYTSIEFGQHCRKAGVRPSMGSVGDAGACPRAGEAGPGGQRHVRELLCHPRMRASRAAPLQDAGRGAKRSLRLHRGVLQSAPPPLSIGYLSPMDFEQRGQKTAADPDARQPAAVLAAVKDKPSGRPQEGAVLDRRCARRPHHRAGRDGRMAPPGAEPKNGSTQEGNMPSNQIA